VAQTDRKWEKTMKRLCSAVLVAGVFAVASSAALAADGTFERTLKVNGPVLLGVDTGSGNIHVSSGPGDTVHIVGHVHSGNGGWFGGGGNAEDRVKQVVANPPVNQAGNIISLGHNFHEDNISIDYDITTPRGTDLRADSGSGDIKVDDEGGPVELQTGSGNITGSGLSDHVSLQTGSGDIQASISAALDVKAQTGSGNIALKGVQSGLWARTGSGNIDVSGRPLAQWKVESGNGNVALNTGGAPLSLNATSGSGNIKYSGGTLKQTGTASPQHVVGDANGGGPQVRVSTGSGDVTVQ
jgi:DUF4097 and DUF4098 domain-containing protein YvlB